jgi:hypothetical protein
VENGKIMGIKSAAIIEGFEQMDFDNRMLVADKIIETALDYWPEQIFADEVAQIQRRAVDLVSAIRFVNF